MASRASQCAASLALLGLSGGQAFVANNGGAPGTALRSAGHAAEAQGGPLGNAAEHSSRAPSSALAAFSGAAVAAAAAVAARRRSAGATATPGAVRRGRVGAASLKVSPDSFAGVCEQTGITLNRYMIELHKRGIIDEDILGIFNSLGEATKVIAKLVNRAPLSQAELLGLQGEVNVQGEDQKKLDVITNEVLKKALQYTGKLGTLASEEEDMPVAGETRTATGEVVSVGDPVLAETGKYVCVFDPLDGSSNVDAGIAVGTIFGIFKEPDSDDCKLPPDLGDLDEEQVSCLAATLQPGKELVAAGYVLYSCSTELVFTVGRGCVGFTLDQSIGEYVLTRPQIQIPPRGKIYSMNEANIGAWDKPMQEYVNAIQSGRGQTGNKYSLRYIGSMVGDVHRTLLYGGIFAYPADEKNVNGKLRLLYEAAPMAFIVEQAGGKAITGHSRVMDIPPIAVHQRVPVILGSKEDVDECKEFFDRCDDPKLKERCENRLKGLVMA